MNPPAIEPDTIASLRASLDAMHGRMNGMLTAMVTITRVLTRDQAERARDLLQDAAEHIAADAVASPLPDALIAEQERVIDGFVATLTEAATPRWRTSTSNRWTLAA